MKLKRLLLSSLSFFSMIGIMSQAYGADADGFAINRFEPSERGSDWFANESLDLRGDFRPAVGIVGDYGYRQFMITESNDPQFRILKHNLFVHVGASFIFMDRLRLSVSFPIQAFVKGDTPQALSTGIPNNQLGPTTFQPPPKKQALGDLRLALDVRLLGEYGDKVTLAVGGQVWFPTGDEKQYTSDGKDGWRFQPRLMVAGDIDMFTYAAKVGYNIRNKSYKVYTGTGLVDYEVKQELAFSAAAGVRLLDRQLIVGPEIFGSTSTKNIFKKQGTPLEALLGAHYWVADSFKIGAGVGMGFQRGYGAPTVRGLLSAEWMPAVATDTDGDGVPDEKDACPNNPGVATDNPNTNGCPVADTDQDGDGIPDSEDACPQTPGVKTDDPNTNGCPVDNDGDGILNKDDACPDAFGSRNDDPSTNGCPDSDSDGIFDKDDRCPQEPGLRTDDPNTNGCPDRDRDRDGIPNDQDACPDLSGNAHEDPKRNGCPTARLEGESIRITQRIEFATGSATLLPSSDEILEAVLAILKENPDVRIQIEGHTDSRGNKQKNMALSKQRAYSVAKWLNTHGISRDRLKSKGYGQEMPIDSNETEEGRQNNRRVEFHVIK